MTKNSIETRLNKKVFLAKLEIESFVLYLSQVLIGNIKLNHKYILARHKKSSDGLVTIRKLEDGYKNYFWRGHTFAETELRLNEIRALFDSNSKDVSASQTYTRAISACLEWGLGKGRAYLANKKWADDRIDTLSTLIDNGVHLLNSDNPDLSPFVNRIRMNAGYTKIFSLLCKNSIIYDGRVGAALGYLVTMFLSEMEESSRADLFQELSFPYGQGQGKNARNRDSSTAEWKFPALTQDSFEHAKWNLKANWIIQAAIEKVSCNKALWVSSSDGLRRVEAALFMVGYEIPKRS